MRRWCCAEGHTVESSSGRFVHPVAISGVRESADGMIRVVKTAKALDPMLVRMEQGIRITLLSYRDAGAYHEYRYVL